MSRLLSTVLVWLALHAAGQCSQAADDASAPANAVSYRGEVYLALDTVRELVGGEAELAAGGRGVQFLAGGRRWEFTNGGDRIQLPSGAERLLTRPLLVIDGRHFVPFEECAADFQYEVKQGPPCQVMHGDKVIQVRVKSVDSPYQAHRVTALAAAHRCLLTGAAVRAHKSLHENEIALPAGTTLLVRRTLQLDGQSYVVATDCGKSLESLLIREDALAGNVTEGALAGTFWESAYRRCAELAQTETGLRRGQARRLPQTIAVTVDLCWSLRKYEQPFFRSWQELARGRQQPVPVVLFVSGRWIEQHPTEMHELIELDAGPGVEWIWGVHSWAHPKSGGFLNEFSPEQVREDTYRLETLLLEWGLVPTVYYRFPGLIHDRVRLQEILNLDLLPVDCDTWMALIRTAKPNPFYHDVRDAGIVLVHGNGNEPRGIEAFANWQQQHPDWQFGHLREFLTAPAQAP